MGANGSKNNVLVGGAQVGVVQKSYLVDAIHEHGGSINCMAISDDGSILATGSEDRYGAMDFSVASYM